MKIQIDLPIALLAKLAILSAEMDKSVNWICNQALKEYIKKMKKKEIPKKKNPHRWKNWFVGTRSEMFPADEYEMIDGVIYKKKK